MSDEYIPSFPIWVLIPKDSKENEVSHVVWFRTRTEARDYKYYADSPINLHGKKRKFKQITRMFPSPCRVSSSGSKQGCEFTLVFDLCNGNAGSHQYAFYFCGPRHFELASDFITLHEHAKKEKPTLIDLSKPFRFTFYCPKI